MIGEKRTKQIHTFLFRQVDISSVLFFRIAFGLIMVWGVSKYISKGLVRFNFIYPNLHVTYPGFGWIQPLPENLLYILFYSLVVLALFIALGFLYRISAILFFLGFSYVFLLDTSYYLNHYYLIILISFLMIFIPANRSFSIDSLIWPKIKSDFIHSWCVYILRFQIGVVYFYGGLAKLNTDWIFGQEPMNTILLKYSESFPLIGHMFTENWVVNVFTYGGLFFDLFIVFFLLWGRTRIYAFVVCILFHLTNVELFNIGIFPWFMIAATLIYFSPSCPRSALNHIWPNGKKPFTGMEHANSIRSHHKLITVLLTIYVLFQVLVPLRHHLYPGNINWGDEGWYLSWHMMGRAKASRNIHFIATDPATQKSWEIDPRKYLVLNIDQKMSIMTRPHSILQLSHYFAEKLREKGYENIEIRASIETTLNGRKPQHMIDPDVDLVKESWNLYPAKWLTKLEEPLPPKEENIMHLLYKQKLDGLKREENHSSDIN